MEPGKCDKALVGGDTKGCCKERVYCKPHTFGRSPERYAAPPGARRAVTTAGITDGSGKLYVFDVDGTLQCTTVPGQKYQVNCHQCRLPPHVAECWATRWDTGRHWRAVCSNQLG